LNSLVRPSTLETAVATPNFTSRVINKSCTIGLFYPAGIGDRLQVAGYRECKPQQWVWSAAALGCVFRSHSQIIPKAKKSTTGQQFGSAQLKTRQYLPPDLSPQLSRP